jgi:glycosyltransferase involved in cell wall biosynthesis
LVVGHTPFGRTTGTVITLSNLFGGWPRDRVAQIHTAAVAPSVEVCERYFRFQPHDAGYYAKRLLGWDTDSPGQATPAIAALRAGADRRPALAGLLGAVCAAADTGPFRISPDFRAWIRDFRPDVVYSMLGSVRLMKVAVAVAETCDVPLVPHFTDDWPATLHATGRLAALARPTVRAHVRRVIRRAPFGLGISQTMAEAYERRYGIAFRTFANCVDDDAFAPSSGDAIRTPEVISPDVMNLVYVGALHLGRADPLVRIATALDGLNASGPRVRLTVHAPEEDLVRYGGAFVGRAHIHLPGPLASDEVPRALRAADVLVHVESFRPEHRRYVRYSLSTKLPQDLAAGRPILGVGPPEVASMAHIRSARAGIVVGADDADALVEPLTRLSRDTELRGRLGRNGVAFAADHHRRTEVAARFAAALREAAAAGPGTVAPLTSDRSGAG